MKSIIGVNMLLGTGHYLCRGGGGGGGGGGGKNILERSKFL